MSLFNLFATAGPIRLEPFTFFLFYFFYFSFSFSKCVTAVRSHF